MKTKTQLFNGECWHDIGYLTNDRELCLMGDHFRYLGDQEDQWYEVIE